MERAGPWDAAGREVSLGEDAELKCAELCLPPSILAFIGIDVIAQRCKDPDTRKTSGEGE